MSSLYVIDANVENLQILLDELPEFSEVLILDASSDGVEQIASYVQGRNGIEALHVISHGSVGAVQLGSVLVDESYLVENGEYWERIGQALSDQGDILLYGCNVAQLQEGQLFLSHLAALTGADVAASSNLTGATVFGGGWVLEEQTGHIEATKLDSLSYGDVLGYNVVATPGKIILETFEEGPCFSIAIQSDGKILATGYHVHKLNLVRLNSNGTLDSFCNGDGVAEYSFGQYSYFTDLKIQEDDKVVVVGSSDGNLALARFNSVDGSLDTSFDGNSGVGNGKVTTDFGHDDEGSGIALQNDGKIVATGWSDGNFILSRYLTDGKLDTSFGRSGKVITNFGGDDDAGCALVIQSDGKIIVAGRTNVNGSYDFAIARYNTNGSLDTSFHGDGKVITGLSVEDALFDLILQKDGKILAAGAVGIFGSADFSLVRYNTNGSLDTTFGQGGRVRTDFGYDDEAYSVCLQADGKIIVAGQTLNGEEGDFAMARYNTNGSLDTSFGVNGKVVTSFVGNDGCGRYECAYEVTVLSNGKILVAGESGDGNFALARYNPNGSLDTSFGVPVIKGAANGDTIVGTIGNDSLLGFAGNDSITGVAGNDTLNGGTGNDSMKGGAGNDVYYVDAVGDVVTEVASAGTDMVFSYLGSYTLPGNVENGRIMTTAVGNLVGNSLSNILYAGVGNNVLNGGSGVDTVSYAYGVSGALGATINLGVTTTQATNGSGSDVLGGIENVTGSANADRLTGNSGNNVLNGGGSGNDTLLGVGGNDSLYGGKGNDSMTGGTGSDRFTFDTALGSSNIDIITDFAHGLDKIVLDDDIFTKVGAPGTLLSGAFRKGSGVTTAGDADDRIILNTTTGRLYYDANGSSAGAAVHFATLTGSSTRTTITASDFLVVA